MQVTETLTEGLKREFKISVPAADIETKMVGRLTELGQSIRIPGFRPGKVPLGLLRKRYGDAVRGEILETTIQDATTDAMSDHGIRPAMQPKVDIVKFEEGEDLEYTVAVELLPEIEPMDFSKLDLERLVAEPGEEQIDDAIKRLSSQRRAFKPVEDGSAAKEGDQVRIDFEGKVDGEVFEGGTASDFILELGSGQFIPGFEEQLVGAAPGEERTVSITFPDSYPSETLKGKDAEFAVTVKEVLVPEEVAIDDEFAKSMGLDDLDALKSAIKEQLEREFGQVSRARLKRTLLDKLAESHSFELPPGMVEQEFEAIWTQVKDAMEQDRLDEDDKGKTEDELRERYHPIAERRVRLGLLLSEVGRANNITVSQEDLNRAMMDQARRFPGQESKIFEFYQKNPQAIQELQAPIFEEKVVDFILEMAKVADRTVGVDDLMAEMDEVEV
jgi:trigger factor